MTDVLLGRQPILDRDERVHGYELLCRSEGAARASALDGDRLTATVVLNAFVELGVDAPPDPGPTFVRMTARFLLERLYLSLPKEQVVLTLGVDDAPSPAVVDALRAARMRGFRTALDRVDGRPAPTRLLRFVEFARVDVAALGIDAAAALGPTLRDAGVTPVATKVETRDAFDACRNAGYALFQGFFFRRPDVVRARRVPTARLPVVELLARVRDPEVDLRRLVRLVEANPTLGVHILRMAKAPSDGDAGSIVSIRHAVQRLGLERVRSGLTLLLLTDVDEKPPALATAGLVRARTCRLLARRIGNPREEAFFSTGLFSILDAVLDLPLAEALETVAVAPALRRSILERNDLPGLALEAALSCEEGRAPAEDAFARFGFRAIREAHLEALRWARRRGSTS